MPRRTRAPKDDAPFPPGWEPFLAAICADPGDDTARLVLADWLQENGDELRAEFIRVQCELFRAYPNYDNDFAGARAAFTAEQRGRWEREGNLFNLHRSRWTDGFPKWARGSRFRRGFAFSFTATAQRWLADGERVRRLTPVEVLSLERFEGLEREVLLAPSLVGLDRLFLPDLASGGARVLADSPALDSLTGLAVGAGGRWILGGDETAFLGSARLANLRHLWLRSNPIGDAAALAVAASRALTRLEEVTISNAQMQARGFAALVESPNLERVRVLNVQANGFANRGVLALVGSKLASLDELNMRYCGLTAAAAGLLASWPGLRSVRVLRLGGNNFGAAAARTLLASEHLANVVTLELPKLGITKAEHEALFALPEYQRIASVSLVS